MKLVHYQKACVDWSGTCPKTIVPLRAAAAARQSLQITTLSVLQIRSVLFEPHCVFEQCIMFDGAPQYRSEPSVCLTLARGEGMQPPFMSFFFLKWPQNRWADGDDILHGLWGILCATVGNKFWPDQVRSQSYDVMRGTASGRFFKEIVFSTA